jgi:hypothetical protein
VETKLQARRQRPALFMKEEYIGAGKLKSDARHHGCDHKQDANRSNYSRLHVRAVAERCYSFGGLGRHLKPLRVFMTEAHIVMGPEEQQR